MAHDESSRLRLRLKRPVDAKRDHLRGVRDEAAVVVVSYEDFLCPYCRTLHAVFRKLRKALGDRLVYVFRHSPNERAHPGANLAARAAEAAARQGRFFEMHDWLFGRKPPIEKAEILEFARGLGLDLARFTRDLESDEVQERVAQDAAYADENGVTGTPTVFIDGIRYDGAWDYHSILEALERPIAERVQRSVRAFASLPTSAGLVLLLAAVLALACANSPLRDLYERVMNAQLAVGPTGSSLALTTRDWCGEGLLTFFFLLVGLEIRREMTSGALSDWRAATLPILAAVGGVVTPALLYLALNRGATARGWSIPTATDIAFSLGLLAVLGERIPSGVRLFVASLAVVDDILSVLVLAVFYPGSFAPRFVIAALGAVLVLIAMNRARVYAVWPYFAAGIALWLSLHSLGVHAALTGVFVAMFLPTLPRPAPAPLLAQAATALAALEHAEREGRDAGKRGGSEPVWEWAARNLSAASERFVSPAERIERALAPWSAYVILPAFAFSASGVRIALDFSSHDSARIFAGIVVGLVIGKPLGILLASFGAIASRIARAPEGLTPRHFFGAACLCGVSDTLAFLMADRALAPENAAVAKIAVLTGSIVAGSLGSLVLRSRAAAVTPARS